MKKYMTILFTVFAFNGISAQQLDNNELYSLIIEENELALATGKSCNAIGRTIRKDSFEEELDYALHIHDTASTLISEELALEHTIKVTKKYPNEWIGYYWAAHLYGQVGRLYDNNDKFIKYMETAHLFLEKARNSNLSPSHEDKSELFVLEALLFRLSAFTLYNPRTGVNIDKKGSLQYVDKSLSLLKEAERENANNPRVYLQKGIVCTMDADYEQGVQFLKKSQLLFENNPSSGKIYPNWGEGWLKVWLPRSEKLMEDQSNN